MRKTRPTITLASGSPAGSSLPGFNEVFRFNVAADSRGFLTVDKLTFKITSTDMSANGWNDCDATDLGVASRWALYDANDLSTELGSEDSDWAFYDSVGGNCSFNEILNWATIELDETTDDSDEIAAGKTKTYVLKIDTTGADTVDDDSIRVDIDTEASVDANVVATTDAIEWGDDTETGDIDGTYIESLPVYGGTITY